MATVSLGLAQRVGGWVDRLPSWREAVRLRRNTGRSDEPHGPVARIVEDEILPRLLLGPAMQAAGAGLRDHLPRDLSGGTPVAIAQREADAFAPRLLTTETLDLLTEVEALLARGVPVRSVLLDLFVPTARRLGEQWEDDTISFVEVTMGLWRLQELTREITATHAPAPGPEAPAVLLCMIPGDQHSFGPLILEESFRLAGWRTQLVTDAACTDELTAHAAGGHYDAITLSVAQAGQHNAAETLISALRTWSLNPLSLILVGGPAIGGDEALARALGADETAADAASAVQLAEEHYRATVATSARC